MDSAVRDISSTAPAQACVESKARPPNAIATPTIACRRVDSLASAAKLFLSLILKSSPVLRSPSPHKSIDQKYVQDNIFCRLANALRGILKPLRTRRVYALP